MEKNGRMMADLITLTCPTCGGRLTVADGVERLACVHCGNEYLVRRTGSTVYLEKTMVELGSSLERNTAELAIPRLRGEIAELEKEIGVIDAAIAGDKDILAKLEKEYAETDFFSVLTKLAMAMVAAAMFSGCLMLAAAVTAAIAVSVLHLWPYVGPALLAGAVLYGLLEPASIRRRLATKIAAQKWRLENRLHDDLPRREAYEADRRRKQELLEHYQAVAG